MLRLFYMAGGLLAVGLAIVGAFLPIMPTVPFLIVAVFCFARSEPEWERRLLEHHHYGQVLRDWGERGAIRRKFKLISIGAMACGVGFSWFTIGWPWVLISITVLVVFGAWIWTRPE
jgi:uncharacterized membrane protein YbaN (DUF454 family)